MLILLYYSFTHSLLTRGLKPRSYLLLFNSIQFFIIYVPSQQLQGQLQTQHSVDTIIMIVKQYSNNNDNNNNNNSRSKQYTDIITIISILFWPTIIISNNNSNNNNNNNNKCTNKFVCEAEFFFFYLYGYKYVELFLLYRRPPATWKWQFGFCSEDRREGGFGAKSFWASGLNYEMKWDRIRRKKERKNKRVRRRNVYRIFVSAL
jgi:hypothetical protein